MNFLILTPAEKLSSGEFKVVRPKTVEHIQNILNKKEGDSVKAGILNRSLGLFRILSLDADRKEIVGKFVSIITPKRRSPEIRLLAAVQRPPTVDKIIQLAGIWGVAKIEFLLADLSRKEYLTSPVWKNESMERNLSLGMEQGGNIFKPEISLGFTLPGTKVGFIKKENFRERIELSSHSSFYLDRKGEYLSEDSISLSSPNKICTVLLGPEAGWTKSELSVFRKRKLEAIRLSASILRSEQAFAFFLAQFESKSPRKNVF